MCSSLGAFGIIKSHIPIFRRLLGQFFSNLVCEVVNIVTATCVCISEYLDY